MITAGFIMENLFRLLFLRELRFHFDRIPLKAQKISGKKLFNLFRISFNRLFPLVPALGWPYMAHISPAGVCNLRCPLCPAHDPQARGKELLSLTTFKKLIDEIGDYLIYIILWSWGEPFLNPQIYQMIRYAHDRNILTVTSSNLNRFTKEDAAKVVDSGLDALIIALDGVSEETYQQYRSGGSARRAIENTRLLIEEKKKKGSKKPFLNLRMVVSKFNEKEIDAFRSLGRELGVDMVSFKAFATRQLGYASPAIDRYFAPDRDDLRWYEYLPDYSVSRRLKKYKCKFPWTKPTLFPDGEIIACEFDFYYSCSFGNLNQQSFHEIWFGSRAKEFRRRFLKNREEIAFCRDCVFDYTRFPGCVIAWEYLKP